MLKITAGVAGLDRLRAKMDSLPARARAAACDGLQALAESAAAAIRENLGVGDAVTVEPNQDGVRIDVDLPYAAALEFGTTTMAARPFLRPAAARAGASAADELAPRLHRALTQD